MSDRTRYLIARHLEAELTDDERTELNDVLLNDPAARTELIEATLHARFIATRLNAELVDNADAGNRRPETSSQRPAGGNHVLPILALAAALLLSAAAVTAYLFVIAPGSEPPDPQPVSVPIATLIDATGTVVIDDDVANPGSEYAPGLYAIDSGTAQFMLSNRVTVDLKGATRLRMDRPSSVFMAEGNAEFNVPAGAVGFTVNLPDGSRIVDLGTRFRVHVDEDGATRFSVREGSVSWSRSEDGAAPVLVVAGQSAHVADGRLEMDLNPGLVAYWPLDDGPVGSAVTGADDRIDDPDHPATDATVEGEGDTWVDDSERGVVLSTTGTGNLIAGTQGIDGDFTWSLWIKTDELSGRVVMGNRGGSRPWNKLMTTGLNSWATVVPEGEDGFGVSDGRWHHMAVRRAGETVTVYVDGEPVDAARDVTDNLDAPLRIGGDGIFGERVTALLSDVAVWNIALDESRIRALAADGPVILPEPTSIKDAALSARTSTEPTGRHGVGDKD